jgi:hypothetical protein
MVNKGNFMVGEQPTYTITGAAPNQTVFWNTWLNGTPIQLNFANGATNASGFATIAAGAWAANTVGNWTIQVVVSGKASNSIGLTVAAPVLTLSANKAVYNVGEFPVYTITGGAPNQTVFWNSWLNGTPAVAGFPNGATDASGRATITGGPWAAGHAGNWSMNVTIGGVTSGTISFRVQ